MPENRHHTVFHEFRRFSGNVPVNSQYDFLGTIARPEFLALESSGDVMAVAPDYPPYDEEYFEWIDVLESVLLAGPEYTMMELGAGYGRWAIRAAFAAQQRSKASSLVAVEAESTHFQWMEAHFRENGLDPAQHRLIHGAVTDKPSRVSFLVEAPYGGSPGAWYGQAIVDHGDKLEKVEARQYFGSPIQSHRSGSKSISVLGTTLEELVSGCKNIVDLIDLDIQGHELTVISAGIKALNQKVRRLHIGTHSKDIEKGPRVLLHKHEWSCHADYAMGSRCDTPWGDIQFQDGVQSWTNPRLPAELSL
jgi:FkbM family methyltransferase